MSQLKWLWLAVGFLAALGTGIAMRSCQFDGDYGDMGNTMVVFCDGRVEGSQVIAAFFNGHLCIRQYPWGSIERSRWYYVEEISAEWSAALQKWANRRGEVGAPFEPGEGLLHRAIFRVDRNDDELREYFDEGKSPLGLWIMELRETYAVDEYKVAGPPSWIKESARARRLFGMVDVD